jgi:hypothetical protein
MRDAPQRRDPKSLSDEELATICAPSNISRIIAAWPNAFGFGVTVALFFAFFAGLQLEWLGRLVFGVAVPPFTGVFGLVGAFLLALRLMGLPKRRYRKELHYRWSSQAIAELEAMRCHPEADWVLLFTANGHRRSSFWWVRLALKEGPPPSARADLGILPERQPQHWVEREVPDDIVQDVLRLLKGLDLAALTTPSTSWLDDSISPASWWRLTVLRRDPRRGPSSVVETTAVIVDVPDLSSELLRHPTANACATLCHIARRLSPEPVLRI